MYQAPKQLVRDKHSSFFVKSIFNEKKLTLSPRAFKLYFFLFLMLQTN
jgi:hypothetical protein